MHAPFCFLHISPRRPVVPLRTTLLLAFANRARCHLQSKAEHGGWRRGSAAASLRSEGKGRHRAGPRSAFFLPPLSAAAPADRCSGTGVGRSVRSQRALPAPSRTAPRCPPPAPLPSFGVSPFASNSNGEPGCAWRHGQPVPCLRPSLRRRADFGEPPAALEPLGAGRWAARGGRAGDSPPTPAGRTPLLLEGVGLGAGSRGRGGETGRKAAGRGSGLPAADGSERGGSNE